MAQRPSLPSLRSAIWGDDPETHPSSSSTVNTSSWPRTNDLSMYSLRGSALPPPQPLSPSFGPPPMNHPPYYVGRAGSPGGYEGSTELGDGLCAPISSVGLTGHAPGPIPLRVEYAASSPARSVASTSPGSYGGPQVSPISASASSSTPAASVGGSSWSSGPWVCEYPDCGKVFTRSFNLQQHRLAIHLNQRRFECSHCGQTFYRKNDVTRHERSHTGERPYKCDVCGQGFTRSDLLTRHRQYGPCNNAASAA